MIKKIYANKPSFRAVELQGGFNVVWAERALESTKKDSRNGLGKSTLIEIIHFCLGANAKKGSGLLVKELSGWEFTLDLILGGRECSASRRVDEPGVIYIEGHAPHWEIKPRLKGNKYVYGIRDWNLLLGLLCFGVQAELTSKYQPSFRSLISYCIRRGKDSFSTPFEHHRKQKEWDKQVNNAFLLGLSWSDASELQLLKDRKKGLDGLKQAAKAGVVKGFVGTLGELEARRVSLQRRVDSDAASLATFSVHPQYQEIRVQANRLTEEIHAAENQSARDLRMISLYANALSEEQVAVPNAISKLYADAGVSLPGVVLRRIEDVQAFHHDVIANRRDFLSSEVDRLRRDISARDTRVRALVDERSALMQILQTHGALEEYLLIQRRHLAAQGELNTVVDTIANLKSCEDGLSKVKIDLEVTQQRARRDYDERRNVWERSIELFNGYTERLYNVPGRLIIDFGSTGFRFDIEIERSGSAGVGNMKIFCYDMTIAALWSGRSPSPRLLIHDSAIFDGVDERQRAKALEVAATESGALGFQYICTLNSDEVPWDQFSDGFDLRRFVRAELTDADLSGSLLGLRF